MDKEWLTAVGAALGLTALVQISPIKINPWTWAWNGLKRGWRGFTRSLTAPVLEQIEENRRQLEAMDQKLTAHIAVDDSREADKVRGHILRFNNELMRDVAHTEEEFVDTLAQIDWYHSYCQSHPDYKNSRAVHAIANIERVYDDRLKNNDFL